MSLCWVDADVVMLLLFSVLMRWGISLNSYSGQGKRPMFGDYEAQRHWMEITSQLPATDWYRQTENNDLEYWGLDYPPLTALHSSVMGHVANAINTSWVELGTSRGMESYTHKLFMRHTVLWADVLLYIVPVLVFFMTGKNNLSNKSKKLAAASVLLYPGLMLIDHGHFQYNCISLGLAVLAVTMLETRHDLVATMLFCFALNYKQMELYHALPFFCYLLGSAFRGKEFWLLKVLKLGLMVILAFAVSWCWVLDSSSVKACLDSALIVLRRLFPFARGIYEDKVANFWCSVSVLIKLKQMLEAQTLIKICLTVTAAGLLPSSLHLLKHPSPKIFKLALINSSLVFFLFSFQVHEKSILLAAIPVCLVFGDYPIASSWFLFISTFSMLPLLIKDGLVTPFVVSTMTFAVVVYAFVQSIQDTRTAEKDQATLKKAVIVSFVLSMLGCVVLTVCSLTVVPPPTLPDLFAVLVSSYACAHFLLFLVYFHYIQLSLSRTPAVPQVKTFSEQQQQQQQPTQQPKQKQQKKSRGTKFHRNRNEKQD